MNQQMLAIYLPLLTPLATLAIVMVGFLYNNSRLSDFRSDFRSSIADLRAEFGDLRTELRGGMNDMRDMLRRRNEGDPNHNG